MEDSFYTYLGGIMAIDGDLAQDGWLARLGLGYGEYDYDTTAIAFPATTNVDGDHNSIDLMAGYQHFYDRGRVTFFAGVHRADHDLSPNDTNNPTRGSEVGAKAQLEILHDITTKWGIDLAASGTTVFNGYWGRARLGYNLDQLGEGVYLGPEAILLGGESFDQRRLGIYINGVDLGPVNVGASTGQAWNSRRGENSMYFTANFGTTF